MNPNGCPSWLKDAVFYEIYPQSFKDTNGDGIGDLQGIIDKLDYIKYLGCNAIWLNPCFVSAFGDAGYDIVDYYNVAPRYGNNDDMKRLFMEAEKKDIKICLDLVPGHTSVQCEWFKQSCKAEENEYTNRYVWTDAIWRGAPKGYEIVRGYSERNGSYVSNYFYMQPALNYGFQNIDPDSPWQLPTDHPDVIKNREEMKNIIRFWMDMGASGFRVDMAMSLVKNDPEKIGTAKIWQDIRKMMDTEYPDGVLISEWSDPSVAIPAGFHVDFLLFEPSTYSSLFRLECKMFYQPMPRNPNSFFNKAGKGNILEFLGDYQKQYNSTRDKGYMSIVSGNHDLPRISLGRDKDDLLAAFAFILTMPGVPFIYYGDEIGMRYIEDLKSKEGGYHRTGSRTPMQWDNTKNAGFSTGNEEDLYLPLDPAEDRPAVDAQIDKPESLLEQVRRLVALRHAHPALQSAGDFRVLYAEEDKYPFVYEREDSGERIIVVVNPSSESCHVSFNVKDISDIEPILVKGNTSLENRSGVVDVNISGVSYGIYKVS